MEPEGDEGPGVVEVEGRSSMMASGELSLTDGEGRGERVAEGSLYDKVGACIFFRQFSIVAF